MNHNMTKKLIFGLVLSFFTVATIFTLGCSAKKIKVVYEKEGGRGYSEGSHKHKKGGPPPHAPAHGYRAKYRYKYYPRASVYYDYGRKIYFYIKGDRWEFGASLPSHIGVSLGDSVIIELYTDKPYIHHADHKKRYPPGHLKNKHKKKQKWG